jgi:VanZ family protein
LRRIIIFRIVAWCLAVAILMLSLVPPDLRPETGVPHAAEHFTIYAVTGTAFGLGYAQREAFLAATLIIFAGIVELAQLLVPGRHARLSDFIIDALAMGLGVAAASLSRRLGGLR